MPDSTTLPVTAAELDQKLFKRASTYDGVLHIAREAIAILRIIEAELRTARERLSQYQSAETGEYLSIVDRALFEAVADTAKTLAAVVKQQGSQLGTQDARVEAAERRAEYAEAGLEYVLSRANNCTYILDLIDREVGLSPLEEKRLAGLREAVATAQERVARKEAGWSSD